MHYALNKERYIRKALVRKERLRAENYRELLHFLKDRACVDCSENDPLVLEFDHVGNKSFAISQALRNKAWAEIRTEIEKCEGVCANCHRKRTAMRGGFARVLALANHPQPDVS